MSVLGEVFDSLRAMTQWQLLLAFLACMGYALSQGRLIEPRGRRIAAALALASGFGFVMESRNGADAAMLLAFAVSGLGVFAALVWLISHGLGLAHATREADNDSIGPDAVTAPVSGAAPHRRRGARRSSGPAHSH